MGEASHVIGAPALAPARRPTERLFYLSITGAMGAAVVPGFSRSYFLRGWFGAFAAEHAPGEPYFYVVHAPLCVAWFALLIFQASLVARGRLRLHRNLGGYGAVLATLVVVTGLVGGVIAANRPTGFVDVPVPPLQFLLHVVVLFALYGTFVALAVVDRRDPQRHKRWMLLASLNLVAAAIVRWPFRFMAVDLPVPFYSMGDVVLWMFLAAMVAWDLRTVRRVHPVTLSGGLVLIAAPAFVGICAPAQAWLAIAGFLVGLRGA